MEELVQKINELSAAFAADASAQAVKGNKAAGLRARKNALALIDLLKEFRKASVEKAKEYPLLPFNHQSPFEMRHPWAHLRTWMSCYVVYEATSRSSVTGADLFFPRACANRFLRLVAHQFADLFPRTRCVRTLRAYWSACPGPAQSADGRHLPLRSFFV